MFPFDLFPQTFLPFELVTFECFYSYGFHLLVSEGKFSEKTNISVLNFMVTTEFTVHLIRTDLPYVVESSHVDNEDLVFWIPLGTPELKFLWVRRQAL